MSDDLQVERSTLVEPRRWWRRRWLTWVAAAVFLVAIGWWAILAASQLEQDPTEVRSPLIGKPTPAFALPTLDGDGEIASDDYAGQVLVVNFWASWCVPCRREAPHLQAFHKRWEARGVTLVGIVYNDSTTAAREFRDEFGLTFPQALDSQGLAAIDFGVFGIPETFVIDEQGIVMAKLIGAVGPTTLDEVVIRVRSGEQVSDESDDYWTSPTG